MTCVEFEVEFDVELDVQFVDELLDEFTCELFQKYEELFLILVELLLNELDEFVVLLLAARTSTISTLSITNPILIPDSGSYP